MKAVVVKEREGVRMEVNLCRLRTVGHGSALLHSDPARKSDVRAASRHAKGNPMGSTAG